MIVAPNIRNLCEYWRFTQAGLYLTDSEATPRTCAQIAVTLTRFAYSEAALTLYLADYTHEKFMQLQAWRVSEDQWVPGTLHLQFHGIPTLYLSAQEQPVLSAEQIAQRYRDMVRQEELNRLAEEMG